jgi:hypothetical protein
MQIDPIGLELDVVPSLLAVVFAPGLHGQHPDVSQEPLQRGKQVSYGHPPGVADWRVSNVRVASAVLGQVTSRSGRAYAGAGDLRRMQSAVASAYASRSLRVGDLAWLARHHTHRELALDIRLWEDDQGRLLGMDVLPLEWRTQPVCYAWLRRRCARRCDGGSHRAGGTDLGRRW